MRGLRGVRGARGVRGLLVADRLELLGGDGSALRALRWPRRRVARAAGRRELGTFTAPAGEAGIGGNNLRLIGGQRAPLSKTLTRLDGPLHLDYGGRLEHVDVSWEEWGDPTLPASRTVYIVPSFSNSSHVVRNLNDPSPGWWEGMVGPGLYIDTNRFRVISASNLGGPFGTTSPLSTDPSTGAQYRMGFPQITPADQARVHRMLLQHLGLSELHAMIGSSMGGMIALQFAALYPDYVRRLGVTACTAKTTPGTVARRRVQRRAIVADPNFAGGNYETTPDGAWPTEGMKVAREIGMICYRSRAEFDERFAWTVNAEEFQAAGAATQTLTGARHEVEKYLALSRGRAEWLEQLMQCMPRKEMRSEKTVNLVYMEYMGQKFAQARYDPCCYLLQSRSMDLMDIGFGAGSHAEGTRRIDCERVFACAILQDELIPSHELEDFAQLLATRDGGGSVVFEPMDSIYGHDAFFKEFAWLGPRLKRLLIDGLETELALDEQSRPEMAI